MALTYLQGAPGPVTLRAPQQGPSAGPYGGEQKGRTCLPGCRRRRTSELQ